MAPVSPPWPESFPHMFCMVLSILTQHPVGRFQDAQTSVAVYLACLPESLQNDKIKVYSDFLNDIKDKEDRMHVYEAARTAGLPIDEITKTVVETTRRQGNDPFQVGTLRDSSILLTQCRLWSYHVCPCILTQCLYAYQLRPTILTSWPYGPISRGLPC